MSHEVQYTTKSGEIYSFDTTPEKVKEYSGFYPSERVHTPRGYGSVIGLHSGHVWVHVDGDRGASYWDDCKSPEDFERKDIWLVDRENKPVKRSPVKKFLVQYGTSAKILKLELPDDIPTFKDMLRKQIKFGEVDTDDSNFDLKLFSSEVEDFLDLDDMNRVKSSRVAKVKILTRMTEV
eukprot:TRINITY_DN1267_c0_g1_i2.p1 TRINITY_DN1267_c0_g1~~TRINITY_DN1267_c0_g1_i2.p1  ORF type:complete len:195 (-),score=43.88 TRINITY_DN1267_c0_g1_i2:78-614(-)